MTNSITYASRIQRGMLPPTNQIITVLPEHFILYMPRDIVSGDFYWFAEKEEVSLLAAADCTGHGVPGAFMSMICIALLDSIVYEKNITSPDKVLERLSRDVIATLDQKNTNSHDGMDVVLLSISKDKKTVQYAGAKNPLFYVTNNEIHEIKGDKCPVGDPYYPEDRQFTAHTIQITSPTYFYALSDGYPDQFGGKEKRKFGKKELRNILLNVHTEEMDRQRHILQENITQWMDRGLEKQIDDILVIGVKLG
jgi:serine phosphatase RsbU (regulator of sigma subunit)